jgi:hypothetical protein
VIYGDAAFGLIYSSDGVLAVHELEDEEGMKDLCKNP